MVLCIFQLEEPHDFWGQNSNHRKRQERQGNSNHSRASQGQSFHSTHSGGSPSGGSSSSTRSFRSRPKTGKPRASISDKIKWDGSYSTFKIYKAGIHSHLLQTGADYLLTSEFQTKYQEHYNQGSDYLTSLDFKMGPWIVTSTQAKIDRTWLYGILVGTNRQAGEKKIINAYETSLDGIMAWIDFVNDYDNHGSNRIRVQVLEEYIKIPYTRTYNGGLLQYLDSLEANLTELELLEPGDYSDNRKCKILQDNMEDAPGNKIVGLLQRCIDTSMNFKQSVAYIRVHGITKSDILGEKATQQVHHVANEEKSYDECRHTFNLMAKEIGQVKAYNTIKGSATLRQQLQIPAHIWGPLSKDLKKQILDQRDKIIKETESPHKQPEPKKTELPSQYNLKNNNVDHKTAIANLVEAYDDMGIDSDTDDDDSSVMEVQGYVVQHATEDDPEDITVQAHTEYEDRMIALMQHVKTQENVCHQ